MFCGFLSTIGLVVFILFCIYVVLASLGAFSR